MRNLFLIIFICSTTLVWAEEKIPETQDTSISQEEIQKEKKEYKTKNYTIKEETDVVEQALQVFKKKSKPSSIYRKKVWIYDTLGEDNASFLSFTTNDQNSDIVFSPDEDFVYYVELSPNGRRRIAGVKVGSDKKFYVGASIGSFYIETCEEKETDYLVVLDDAEDGGYRVYDLEGQSVLLPDMPASVDDFKRAICY